MTQGPLTLISKWQSSTGSQLYLTPSLGLGTIIIYISLLAHLISWEVSHVS